MPSSSRVFRRVTYVLPALALFMLAASCNGFFVSPSSIQTVTLSESAVLLKADAATADTYTLSALATDVNNDPATDVTSTATWTSSNTTVASVASGVITAGSNTAANQTATITAKDSGVSGTANILTYTGTAPTGTSAITIVIPTGITLNVTPGETFQLTATADLSGNATLNVSKYVSWTSNNSAIATVSTSGTVTVLSTAVAGDNFTITATANLGTAATGTASGTSSTFSLPSI